MLWICLQCTEFVQGTRNCWIKAPPSSPNESPLWTMALNHEENNIFSQGDGCSTSWDKCLWEKLWETWIIFKWKLSLPFKASLPCEYFKNSWAPAGIFVTVLETSSQHDQKKWNIWWTVETVFMKSKQEKGRWKKGKLLSQQQTFSSREPNNWFSS